MTVEEAPDKATVRRYLADRTVRGPTLSVGASAIYEDYLAWARQAGTPPVAVATQTLFGRLVNNLDGVHRHRYRTGVIYTGIDYRRTP